MRVLSAQFAPGTTTADHPVLALVVALLAASLGWFWMMMRLRRDAVGRAVLVGLMVFGAVLRAMFAGSTPVYEDDYRRYLWDGAVVAHGGDPYRYSPAQVSAAAEPGAASVPELAELALLSREAPRLVRGINNPDLTTIYPPAAQAAFAAAHLVAPFERDGLRLVFGAVELAGLALMLAALARWGRAQSLALLYWLNPVVIFTTYSGLHMDVLLVPGLVGCVLWLRTKPFAAGAMLALAAGVKLWPLLLAPIAFRGVWRRSGVMGLLVLWIGGLSALLLAPMLVQAGQGSGLAAYSSGWVNSSFLFRVIRWTLSVADDPDGLARAVVAFVLVGLSLWWGLRRPREERTVPLHMLGLTTALILLSPTGYPWYLIWIAALLPFAPKVWIGALFLGACAYYGRFWLGENGQYIWYTAGLVPLWYGGPTLLGSIGWARRRRV